MLATLGDCKQSLSLVRLTPDLVDNLPEGVTTEVVEHRVPQDELECPICGETMQEIGKEVVRKLKIIPAQVVVVEHRYIKGGGYAD